MLLNPSPFNARRFSISNKHKSFVAEASDLGYRAGQTPGGPLYDDAADVGLTLLNLETSARSHWYETAPLRDERDIVAWIYKPCPETLRKNPQLEGWEVHILND